MKITCVVLARNAEHNVTHLAEWFDEVLLVIDSTEKKPVASGPYHVVFHPLAGDFSAHRNYALSLAKNDWVFFLDEDETITQALVAELHSIDPHLHIGYRLHRQDFFMGKHLKYGETAHVTLVRFGQRNAGSWRRSVHEIWQLQGSVGSLRYPIMHKPHNSIESFIEKINAYTSLEVQHRKAAGKRFSLFELILYPSVKFLQNYVLRLGFLDGFPGLAMAYMMSLHSCVVRIKMYETPLK